MICSNVCYKFYIKYLDYKEGNISNKNGKYKKTIY